jgi:hypothetical protein
MKNIPTHRKWRLPVFLNKGLTTELVWNATVARQFPAMWAEYVTDSLEFTVKSSTKLPWSIQQYAVKLSITIHSLQHDIPHNTPKILSDYI